MDNSKPASLEKSLVDLEAENRRLKEQLERMKVDTSDQLTQLKERSEKVTDQIKAYTPIVEDVWGLRVFEKAKSYLIGWITLGGVSALIASIAVFAGAYKYALDLIDAKVKALSESQVNAIVQKETQEQVAKYFKDHSAEYEVHVTQMTQEFIQQVNTRVQSKLGYGLSAATERNEQLTTSIASIVDYSPRMLSVRQQGNEGGVVGFAIAYALEYQAFKTSSQRVRLSPREIYNLSRKLEGTLSHDSGATVKDAVKVVQTEGAVEEEIWPYKPGEYSAQAPAAFSTAKRYKVKHAQKLATLEDIKAALSNNGPIVAGITVYQSMMTDDVK